MQTLFLHFETLQFGTKIRILILITKCRLIRRRRPVWKSYITMKRYQHCGALKYDILVCICWNLWFLLWPFVLLIFFFRVGYHYGFYGFPGLFLAAICAHSLSIISTGFNAISQGLWVQLFVRVSSVITK